MGLPLARLFGNSSEFWLRAQEAWDLWETEQFRGDELSQPLEVPVI